MFTHGHLNIILKMPVQIIMDEHVYTLSQPLINLFFRELSAEKRTLQSPIRVLLNSFFYGRRQTLNKV